MRVGLKKAAFSYQKGRSSSCRPLSFTEEGGLWLGSPGPNRCAALRATAEASTRERCRLDEGTAVPALQQLSDSSGGEVGSLWFH